MISYLGPGAFCFFSHVFLHFLYYTFLNIFFYVFLSHKSQFTGIWWSQVLWILEISVSSVLSSSTILHFLSTYPIYRLHPLTLMQVLCILIPILYIFLYIFPQFPSTSSLSQTRYAVAPGLRVLLQEFARFQGHAGGSPNSFFEARWESPKLVNEKCQAQRARL